MCFFAYNSAKRTNSHLLGRVVSLGSQKPNAERQTHRQMATNPEVGDKRPRSTLSDEESNPSEIDQPPPVAASRRSPSVSEQIEDMVVKNSPPIVLTAHSKASVEEGRTAVETAYIIGEDSARVLQEVHTSVDALILLDVSPSMQPVKSMLQDCVTKLPDLFTDSISSGCKVRNVNCAIGFFGNDVEIMHTGQVVGYERFATLTKVGALNIANQINVNTKGGTNTSLAIEKGLAALKQNRTDCKYTDGYLQHLVIVTDGNPTLGITSTQAIGDIVKDHVNVKQGGAAIMIHVLALGDDVRVQVAEEIVKPTCGLMAHARNGSELLAHMKHIFDPIMSSGMAFCLAISDGRTNNEAPIRYERFGLLTQDNRSALLSLDFPPKSSHGMHQAASITLQREGREGQRLSYTSNVMIKYLEKEDYQRASPDLVHSMLQHMLDERRMQEQEQEQMRNALAANNFQAAIQISQNFTQNYHDQNHNSAYRRSSIRTARLQEMADAAANMPPMDTNSATMTTMSLQSQSFY